MKIKLKKGKHYLIQRRNYQGQTFEDVIMVVKYVRIATEPEAIKHGYIRGYLGTDVKYEEEIFFPEEAIISSITI